MLLRITWRTYHAAMLQPDVTREIDVVKLKQEISKTPLHGASRFSLKTAATRAFAARPISAQPRDRPLHVLSALCVWRSSAGRRTGLSQGPARHAAQAVRPISPHHQLAQRPFSSVSVLTTKPRRRTSTPNTHAQLLYAGPSARAVASACLAHGLTLTLDGSVQPDREAPISGDLLHRSQVGLKSRYEEDMRRTVQRCLS